MTEHYVTLFDSIFLPQGLALYYSLQQHAGECVLWVVCVDQGCIDALRKLDLPQMRLLDLAQLETPELLAVKPSRSRGEYCWTLTPFVPRWVFELDHSVNRVTYLDADLFFLSSPRRIFEEFEQSGKSLMITDHYFDPDHDLSSEYGKYCVQFMIFCRQGGEQARKWWEEKCIEWCFSKCEDNRFGDQKYIEKFPLLFGDAVHVLRDQRALLAPWNACIYPWSGAVAFHFQGLRVVTSRTLKVFLCAGYRIPAPTLANVYDPYIKCIEDVIRIAAVPLASQPGSINVFFFRFRAFLLHLFGRLPLGGKYAYVRTLQLPSSEGRPRKFVIKNLSLPE